MRLLSWLLYVVVVCCCCCCCLRLSRDCKSRGLTSRYLYVTRAASNNTFFYSLIVTGVQMCVCVCLLVHALLRWGVSAGSHWWPWVSWREHSEAGLVSELRLVTMYVHCRLVGSVDTVRVRIPAYGARAVWRFRKREEDMWWLYLT